MASETTEGPKSLPTRGKAVPTKVMQPVKPKPMVPTIVVGKQAAPAPKPPMAKAEPVKPAPSKPVQPVLKEAAFKPAALKAAPLKPEPFKPVPFKAAPSKPAPVKPAPVKPAPKPFVAAPMIAAKPAPATIVALHEPAVVPSPVAVPVVDLSQTALAPVAVADAMAAAIGAPRVSPPVDPAVESTASRVLAPVVAASEPEPIVPTSIVTAEPSAAVGPLMGPDAVPDVTAIPSPGEPQGPAIVAKTKETFMTTTEEFMSHGQANVEAVVKSGQIWATGFQDLTRSFAESAQAQFDHSVATWKALAGTKSLKEAFDIQTTRGRAALEKAVADTGKLTDASIKLAEQTFAPITARLTVATEKLARPN